MIFNTYHNYIFQILFDYHSLLPNYYYIALNGLKSGLKVKGECIKYGNV